MKYLKHPIQTLPVIECGHEPRLQLTYILVGCSGSGFGSVDMFTGFFNFLLRHSITLRNYHKWVKMLD